MVGVLALGTFTACTDERQETPLQVTPSFAIAGYDYDLTPTGTSPTTINGAVWQFPVPFNVGTGLINPFLTVQARPQEEGFNTEGKYNYDQKRDQFTDSLRLSDIPTIIEPPYGAVREVILDANEANSFPDAGFGVNLFDVYICETGDNAPAYYEDFSDFRPPGNPQCDLIYTFAGENAAASDAATSGSGNALDYRILFPETIFPDDPECEYDPSNTTCMKWMIFDVNFGAPEGDYVTGSTFEELSTIRRPYIAVTKDAVPSYDRQHFWDLTKAVDPDFCSVFPGEDCPAPFDYTIQAVYKDNEDLNHKVTGAITIENPSEDDVQITAVTDQVGSLGSVTPVCGVDFPYTLPAGGQLVCTYELELVGEIPAGTLTNEAVVSFQTVGTADAPAVALGDRTATYDFTFDGLNPTRERSCSFDAVPGDCTEWGTVDVSVIDDFATDPRDPDYLPGNCDGDTNCSEPGPWTASPEISETFTYSRLGVCEADEAGVTKTLTNRAEIEVLGEWAEATVTIECGRFATKSGYKWHDLNADGVWQDGTELPLENWEITLTGIDVDGAVGPLTDYTDATGYYEFIDLKPGDYQVCETLQTDWYQSFPQTTSGCYEFTLVQGQDETDNNFGNYQFATKSGTKFHDQNANATEDAGEPGLEGWEIQISGTDGMGNAVDLSTTTDANGDYAFSVPPGDYVVSEVCPADWYQSVPTPSSTCGSGVYNITLESQEVDSDNDFGNYQFATKSGTKFEDTDADGAAQEASEPGLPGWEITLIGTDGMGNVVNETETTDANGDYSFSVPPGDYEVCETLQTGWIQSYPATADGCYDITLASQDVDADNDFGNYRAASKSGTKFEDTDADGLPREAGEPGLEGWEITLTGTDGMGGPVDLSTTTDVNGDYSFPNLKPGTYQVCETLQTDWYQSFPAGGCYDITLASGDDDTGNDFGNYQNATKSGTKFEDLDADGQPQEAGEPGLAGWTITLQGTDGMGGAVDVSTATDAAGNYSFEVKPGSYQVCEVLQTDWIQSYPASGCYDITLESGDVDAGNDFGNYQEATKSGYKWFDLDNDGIWDTGEAGLPDWTIKLLQGGVEIASTTTGADGSYEFTGLMPGDYQVCEVLQTDWVQSFPDATTGTACTGLDLGPYGYSFNLESGEDETDNNFGNFLPADSETAWASNELGTPLVLPYFPGGGNWATYVEYAAGKTTTLYAGRTNDVGTVTFSAPFDVSGEQMINITINLTGDNYFETGVTNVMIEDYASAPINGSASPGQFEFKFTVDGYPTQQPETFMVPLNNFYGVHALVVSY
jgi:hypothetical protein